MANPLPVEILAARSLPSGRRADGLIPSRSVFALR